MTRIDGNGFDLCQMPDHFLNLEFRCRKIRLKRKGTFQRWFNLNDGKNGDRQNDEKPNKSLRSSALRYADKWDDAPSGRITQDGTIPEFDSL